MHGITVGDIIIENPVAEGFVLFDKTVTKKLVAFRQMSRTAPEQGGILLGYRRERHLDVVAITKPLPGDRCTRYSFARRDPGHEQVARAMWCKSKGCIDYLGEWHTHPERYPTPSPTDIFERRKILKRASAPMLFLIVGMRDWHLSVNNLCLALPLQD